MNSLLSSVLNMACHSVKNILLVCSLSFAYLFIYLLCFFIADLKLIFAYNHLYVSTKATEFCPIIYIIGKY